MDWPIERNLKLKIDRAKYYIQQCGQILNKITILLQVILDEIAWNSQFFIGNYKHGLKTKICPNQGYINRCSNQRWQNHGCRGGGCTAHPLLILADHLGGKYLVFVSFRSVKMRGFSFLSLYKSVFSFHFLNVKMYNYGKQNIIVNFIIQKLKNKDTFLKKYTNWAANIERICPWTFYLPWWKHLFTVGCQLSK